MKVQGLIISLFVFLMLGCSSIKSNEEISLTEIAGRNKVIINYDRNRYALVKLDNIVIDSGRPYYIKSGEYLLSYEEEAVVSGFVDFSWQGSKGGAGSSNRRNMTRENLEIDKDMVIDLKNHLFQLDVSGNINSSKKF